MFSYTLVMPEAHVKMSVCYHLPDSLKMVVGWKRHGLCCLVKVHDSHSVAPLSVPKEASLAAIQLLLLCSSWYVQASIH